MEREMEALEIAPGIYDVGVADWNIRDFHGYSTDLGTTYNSFLIVDQKTVLIDTVKQAFADQLLDNISAVVDPKKIDCVISNHTEMECTGLEKTSPCIAQKWAARICPATLPATGIIIRLKPDRN